MRKILILLTIIISTNAFSNEKLGEATALLNAMNAKESYTVAAKQIKDQLNVDTDMMPQFYDRIFSEMARIYSEVYTLEELKGIRAFYESDAGKAFLEKKPQLTEKYVAVIYNIVDELSQ